MSTSQGSSTGRPRRRLLRNTVLLPNGKGRPRYVSEATQSYFTGTYKHRILVGIPTLGTVRVEWHNAINGLVVPVNWSNSQQTPIGFHTPDAQNLIANHALANNFEWLFLLEDDVVPPPDLLVRMERYMIKGDIPVVSGLYPLKSDIPMPFIFRGRGNGVFTKFTTGDKVWADGVPTGCLLIHMSLVEAMAKHAEWYSLSNNGTPLKLRRIFHAPRTVFSDPAQGSYQKLIGTSDLFFCDQLREKDILRQAGWSAIARRQYPYLVDTGISCGHIDRHTGVIYMVGAHGEELRR